MNQSGSCSALLYVPNWKTLKKSDSLVYWFIHSFSCKSIALKVSSIQNEFMRSLFLPNANPKLQGFLPYHTNKDHSIFFGDFLVSVGRFFGYDPCLFFRAEIRVIFGLHFGRNDDLINSFWIELTSSSTHQKRMETFALQVY